MAKSKVIQLTEAEADELRKHVGRMESAQAVLEIRQTDLQDFIAFLGRQHGVTGSVAELGDRITETLSAFGPPKRKVRKKAIPEQQGVAADDEK